MHLRLSLCAVGTLLLLVACSGPETSTNEDVASLRQENERLRKALKEARQEAASMQRGTTIRVVSTDVYFKSGSAELSPEGVEELKTVASRIKSEYPGRTIRVEGYTDNTPIGEKIVDRFPSNWELSAARAARVVRHFQWTHDMDPKKFEVVAFGPYHPVATNKTEEGRRKNRRVRIAVLDNAEPPSMAER